MSRVIKKLGKIFGSEERVKMLRLFLFNPETPFDVPEIVTRSKVSSRDARRETAALLDAGFLKQKAYVKDIQRNGKTTHKRVMGFMLNPTFGMHDPLRTLLIESELVHVDELPLRFRKAGKIQLFFISGVFIRDPDRVLDILMVGDNLQRSIVDRSIKVLESEIGKEIRYALFDTDEFLYRLRMYDKLVRDVLDYPHVRLIQKLEIGEQ